MVFDRFDICGAWHKFCTRYHSGKSSFGYRKLSQLVRMQYRPSPISYNRFETYNERQIYRNLICRFKQGEINP